MRQCLHCGVDIPAPELSVALPVQGFINERGVWSMYLGLRSKPGLRSFVSADDPKQRDPALAPSDLRNRYVTPEESAIVYGLDASG